MHRIALLLALILATTLARGAEHRFDFSGAPEGEAPADCVSTVSGTGKPGKWRVIQADAPPVPLSPSTNALTAVKKAVVAQLAGDFTDEHFPMLVLGDEVYGDFTLTTRVKMVGGVLEQMAGMAFRVQDEKNYYVVRLSALGRNLRFYEVVNGERRGIVGPDLPVSPGVWYELSIECHGTQIHVLLDGREIMSTPIINNYTFSSGKIAYWTKSDSVSYFTDTRIVYTPREPFVQGLVREAMTRNPKLLGVKVFLLTGQPAATRLVASNDEKEIGRTGERSVTEAITTGHIYYGKENDVTSVVVPLRDRNGDSVAAVRVQMRSFKGQTEENAIVRALPVVKRIQARVSGMSDFLN